MCPDRQLISLYTDGELPSPWKEKMETHLESCPECRAIIGGYRRLGENFQGPEQGKIEAASKRVWNNIPAAGTQERSRRRIWSRTITVPLPAAAAAAVLIAIAFLALAGMGRGNQSARYDTMASIMPEFLPNQVVADNQELVPMQDMAGVLQYLSGQDYGDFMVIRLPESRSFSRIGEPALVNAAGYSQRTGIR